MKPQELNQRRAHLAPRNHRVHKAVLLLVLRPLKALRQSLADGLLNDPGTGKADERPRLGQNDVPQRREAGGDAAGRRICEDGNVEKSALRQPPQGGAGLDRKSVV